VFVGTALLSATSVTLGFAMPLLGGVVSTEKPFDEAPHAARAENVAHAMTE
jgi:hypothetical protein